MSVILSAVVLVVMVVTIVDIVMRDDALIRYMPKFVWLILAILVPLLGSILWFTLGRERTVGEPRPARPFARPAAQPAPPPVRDTRSTEQQLADLDREIEEERLRAEIARRRREQGEG